MRIFAAALVFASAFVCSTAQAQPARTDPSGTCQQEARRQGLGGEALAAFMKRCSAGQVPPQPAPATTKPADPPKASRPPSRDDGRWYLQRPTSY